MNCDLDTAKKVLESGFEIVSFGQNEKGDLEHKSPFMVHVERFIHIFNYLKENNFRYVITTDVKDVIFQSDPFVELDKLITESGKDLVFASESMLYKDEPWGNQNLIETFGPFIHNIFKENEIYNVGVLAGKADAMRDLALNIFLACMGKPIKICDQSTFNVMINMHPYNKNSLFMKSEQGWACQLGTTADPTKIESFRPHLLELTPKFENGKVTTSYGKPFTIVHQYDRVPEWRQQIEEQYE